MAEFCSGNLTAVGISATQADALCTQFASAAVLDSFVPAVEQRFGDFSIELNVLFLLTCGALVFIMHAGFAMLCAGAIRHKNTMNILLQTVLDAGVSALAFYVVGYAFAYGYSTTLDSDGNVVADGWNAFIGNAEFGLARYVSHLNPSGQGTWQDFFFQWAFAATATTIPAGCVAERFNFNAYLGYSFFISAFVYPVVVHWQWSAYGWLGYGRLNGYYHLFTSGMIDYAGSSVVHMVGGLSGMMGCILVGPRLGRFDSSGKPVDMPGHSPILVVLGTVLLWFGWYGFNPGSQILLDYAGSNLTGEPAWGNSAVVSRAAVTTTLSGAAGAVSALFLSFFKHKAWDVIQLCNGALCGFVAVTAGANVLEPWAAIIDGMVAAWVFEGVCMLFLKLRIDDPLSAAPMHAFCGAWGVLFVGFLAKEEYVIQAYGGSHDMYLGGREPAYPYGCFYPGGGGWLLASQVVGILTIAAWVCSLMGVFFFIFKLFGILRISANEEYAGLDVSKHGGSAYAQYPGEPQQVSVVQMAKEDKKGDNIFGQTAATNGNNVKATAE